MLPALFLFVSLTENVQALIAQNNLGAAEQMVQASQRQAGNTSDFAAALSWVARGQLAARQFERADASAVETRKLADRLLVNRKLDSDPWLPTAVGAAIEVHAEVLVAHGERGDAVDFLKEQLAAFHATSIAERIQKNLNLLSLEGKPAPALEAPEWFGPKPPLLSSLRGHPVLLFFWAHWCSDCKAEVPIIAAIEKYFGPKGLVVIAPTRYYGYVEEGRDAAPAVEKKYIEAIRRQYYAALDNLPAPLSNANFLKYGCSTTPTLVLIDGAGVVRLYHPGTMAGAELAARIQALLPK